MSALPQNLSFPKVARPEAPLKVPGPDAGPIESQQYFKAVLEAHGGSDALVWYLENSSWQDVRPLLDVLATNSHPEALLLLTRATMRLKPAGATRAAKALSDLGEVGVPWLLYALEHGDVPTRRQVARALSKPPLAILPTLRKALQTERSKLVRAALGAALFNGAERAPFPDRPKTPEGHAALDQELAKQPAMRLSRWLTLKELPPLRWCSGAPLSEGATTWVLTRLAAEGRDRDPAITTPLGEVLDHTRPEGHALFLGFLERQAAAKGPAKMPKWLLWARARLGDAASMEETALELWWALQGLPNTGAAEELRDILLLAPPGPHLRWFDKVLAQGRWRSFCNTLLRGLVIQGSAVGCSAEDLLEDALPTLGFGCDGRQAVGYGQRVFALVLGSQGGLELQDATGRVFKRMPQARKVDDPDAVKESQRLIRGLRQNFEDFSARQRSRFEQAVGSGRTWTTGRWRGLLAHPLCRWTMRGLVWERVGLAGPQRFLIGEHGELWGADYEAVVLSRSARIRLAHPAEMSAAERAGWWEMLASDNERVPPFDQLNRMILTAADAPASEGRALRSGFVDRLWDRGYRVAGPVGALDGCMRQFMNGWSAHLTYTPFAESFSAWHQDEETTLLRFELRRDGQPQPLEAAPPRVLSEGLSDLRDVLR